jgi:DNA invertase Pin-like site-specific DNA recombinase
MHPKLTAERLERGAMVYIRQSTPGQVLHHRESQRRQYALEQHARQLGFQRVAVIDEDLGRSGSGLVERAGFQQLVSAVCAGAVGAVFCIEASRLARNGREWHYLIELCGLTGTLIVDPDGMYDPTLMNDRLLLGLKGTMSEFELNLLRQRSAEAIRQKAQRGELQFGLPVGYMWTAAGRVEKHPDLRVQQALACVLEDDRTGERAPGITVVPRPRTLFAEERRGSAWVHRLGSAGLQCAAEHGVQSHVWRSLRVRKNQNQNQNHGDRGAGTQECGPPETSFRVDGLDSRPPSRLHFVGAVRTPPSHAGGQCAHEIGNATEGRTGRAGAAERDAALPAVWADVVCVL